MVEVREVWKAFGPRAVLRGISFTAEAGGAVGLIGPNGAGKTTLLRLIAGVERPDRGVVRVEGRPVGAFRRRELARRLAVLSQEAFTPFPFSVYDTVMMGRHPYLRPLRGITPRDREIVERVLAEVGLAEVASERVDRLSGGQRQLVALARTMAQEPRVLLLDEPTTFLDLGHQVRVLDLVRRWQRERGLAVVMVLHDLNLAALYCDRLVLIHEGRVAASGRAAEVLTPEVLESVYGTRPVLVPHPVRGVPQLFVQPDQLPEDRNETPRRVRSAGRE